jgi:hypothetical protein
MHRHIKSLARWQPITTRVVSVISLAGVSRKLTMSLGPLLENAPLQANMLLSSYEEEFYGDFTG